jgi:hypothetical protein
MLALATPASPPRSRTHDQPDGAGPETRQELGLLHLNRQIINRQIVVLDQGRQGDRGRDRYPVGDQAMGLGEGRRGQGRDHQGNRSDQPGACCDAAAVIEAVPL